MKRVVILVLMLALSACGGGTPEASNSPTSPAPVATVRPRSTGALKFLAPAAGAIIGPDHVRVRLELTGARLVPKVSATITPDTGHVHLRLDGKTITLLAGLDVDLTTFTGGPLTKGLHLLEAEFAAADHGFFDPRVIVHTSFTVR